MFATQPATPQHEITQTECLAGRFYRFQLHNGLTVLALQNPSVESVSGEVVFTVGYRHDLPGQKGLRHFYEHLFLDAAKGFPTAAILGNAAHERGIDFNCWTDADWLNASCVGPSSQFSFLLEHLEARAFHSLCLDNEIDFERKRILQEIVLANRDPESKFASGAWPAMIFSGQDFCDALGSVDSVRALTNEQIRSFMKAELSPTRACLVLSGALPENFIDQVVHHFSEATPLTTADLSGQYQSRWDLKLPRSSVSKVFPEYQGYTIKLGFGANAAHSDERFAMGILNNILLRGGPSSLLGVRLGRELGSTYAIDVERFRTHDTGFNTLTYTTAYFDGVVDGIAAIRDSLQHLDTHPEFDDRFRRAVTSRLADIRAAKDEPVAFGSSMRFDWVYGDKILLPDAELDRVLQVTPEHVLALSRKYYDWNSRLLAVTGEPIPANVDLDSF